VDFAALGLGMPLAISARHNLGIRQLKSALIKYLPRAQKKDFGQALKIAIVGRPNVGKSSFFNTLLGSARAVVDDQPGTTRDSVDSLLVSEGSSFLLIDTAGLCRGRESQTLAEIYSWAHSKKAIAQADVCLVLADCQEGLDKLDLDILRFCSAVKGKATILCMNKVDLIDKGQIKSYASSLKLRLGNLSYLPVIFTSAKTGFNLKPALRLAKEVYAQAREKIPTPLLNKILLQAQKKKLPPFIEGKSGKIYYALEKGARPPTFLIYVNSARLFPMAYLKYLENQIRSYFALRAVPIRIELKSKGGRK
jgi:GTP-binding protein